MVAERQVGCEVLSSLKKNEKDIEQTERKKEEIREKKGKKGLVLSVNIYMPSSDSPLRGWTNDGKNDVVRLFTNAFHYAMQYVCYHNR